MLSQCSIDRWMSLTARVRMPNPVRPTSLIMAQRCFDPGRIPEILSYQAAKVGHEGLVRLDRAGFATGYVASCELETVIIESGPKQLQKTGFSWKGGVFSQKKANFLVDFFLVL
jgi:hypothetical protein